MSSKRRTAKDLMARRLGIVRLSGTKEDLALLQQVVDRRILRKTQTEWQAIGILFGDILVRRIQLEMGPL